VTLHMVNERNTQPRSGGVRDCENSNVSLVSLVRMETVVRGSVLSSEAR